MFHLLRVYLSDLVWIGIPASEAFRAGFCCLSLARLHGKALVKAISILASKKAASSCCYL